MYMFMFMRLEMFLENHDHPLKYQHILKKIGYLSMLNIMSWNNDSSILYN